ncbi:hypothetical protein VTN00DRAFT_6425 [Thermoascus crustaceus]|uniref:uncharacterized protein n=1 Tax=Thermoascus crustaceus TaxID=5088 RepID=UPI0037428B5D
MSCHTMLCFTTRFLNSRIMRSYPTGGNKRQDHTTYVRNGRRTCEISLFIYFDICLIGVYRECGRAVHME